MHSMTETWSPATLLAQALGEIEAEYGGVAPPIHTASTYIRDPDNSYLIHKLEGTQAVGIQMPPAGPLQQAIIDDIRQWIDDGALRN